MINDRGGMMSGLLEETQRRLATLDLMPGASWTQVKDRYRFLAKVWHPDRFGADPRARARAEKQFKTVNEAYQWLLHHQDFVESLTEPSEPSTSAEGAGGHDERHTQTSMDSDSEPEGRVARARSFRTPRKPIDQSAVEKFLWGVIATFTLIALAVFVASGSLSRLLEKPDPERPGVASTTGGRSASTTGDVRTSRDEYRWVTASRLYVRSEPSRDAAAVSVLEQGSRVRLRPGATEWMAVVDDAGRTVGWVHGDYVSTAAPAPRRSSPPVEAPPTRSSEDMGADFVAMARTSEAADAMATEAESPPAEETELIRGAWKPKNPDPSAQRREQAQPRTADPDLEHWTGAVEGAVPSDLPRVTLHLVEEVDAGQSLGTAVYRLPSGACTYALEVIQEEGDWIRATQVAESPDCAKQGEIWLMIRESDMTAIWHRRDGRRWFTSRLSMN